MNIDSIINGIVIDHIRAGEGMRIYNFLNLGELDCSVALIKNAHSTKAGKKDIIKVDRVLDIDLNVLGFIDRVDWIDDETVEVIDYKTNHQLFTRDEVDTSLVTRRDDIVITFTGTGF